MAIYGNNILHSYKYKLSYLNEAFVGKTETLLEMEKQIGIIRSSISRSQDINKLPVVQKLNRLFEKQFGMEVFALHVDKNDTINAYTCPVATRFDIAFKEVLYRKVTASKTEGYRFKEGNNLCIICAIYWGLLMSPEFTNGEILAIILHELGHNFADALNKDIEVYNKNMMQGYVYYLVYYCIITLGLAIPSSISAYIKNTNKYVKKKESNKKQNPLRGALSGCKARCEDFKDYIDAICKRLGLQSFIINYNKKVADKNDVPNSVRKSAGRQNEVIADKFAGIYGYGPELASGLLKMEKKQSRSEKFVDSIPVIGKKANKRFNDAIRDIYKYDCHPHTIQRINEEIKLLEYELEKSDVDPKLKKVLKEQLNQLKKLRDECTTVTKNMTEEEIERITYFANVNSLDPDALDKELEDKINKSFDELIEDNKKRN